MGPSCNVLSPFILKYYVFEVMVHHMAGLEELVHIIPLGFEIDRAVKPFEKYSANRAYILTITDHPKYSSPVEMEKNKKQRYYDATVTRLLKEKGIDVRIQEIDMFDILDVMRTVSAIILKEKSENNRVYLNMSACGRLTSVGATLAAMAHDISIYYVRSDGYSRSVEEEREHGLSICTKPHIWQLENFHIALPDETSIRILVRLTGEEQGMTTEALLRYLFEEKVPGFDEDYHMLHMIDRRRKQSNYLMKLNKGILTKIELAGYIERKRSGRNTNVSITESGKYIAYISGLIQP
jgi:hypothetical protein